MALGAGAVGGVEGKAARLELGHVQAAIGAGHAGREQLLFTSGDGHQREAVGELQRLQDGQFQALLHGRFGGGICGRGDCGSVGSGRLEQDAVYDSFDGVVLAPIQQQRLRKIPQFAIDASAKALLIKLIQQFLELAFTPADDRRHHRDALAAAEFEDAGDNLVGGLAGDGAAAVGAVRRSNGGVQQAQVIVDFGNRADGGAGAAAGGFLLDGDGGGEAVDGVDVGALHLI